MIAALVGAALLANMPQDPGDARALAERFARHLDRGEIAAADAMLSTDAAFGAGDVGAPIVTAAAIPLGRLGCRLQGIVEEVVPIGTPAAPAVSVDSHWLCPLSGRETQRVSVFILVAGGRVAGMYMH